MDEVSEQAEKPGPLKLILSGALILAPAVWMKFSEIWMENSFVPKIGPLGNVLLVSGAILYSLIASAIIARLFRNPETDGLGLVYFGFGAVSLFFVCMFFVNGTQQAFYGMYEFSTQKETSATAYYPVLKVNSRNHFVLHSVYKTWAVSNPYNMGYISLPSNDIDFKRAESNPKNTLCYPVDERRAGDVRRFILPDTVPESGFLIPCK